MNFDTKRFVELSKAHEERSLDNDNFEEYIQYVKLLSDHCCWLDQKHYVRLLRLFLDKKITKDEFGSQFNQIRAASNRKYDEVQKKLLNEETNLKIDPELSGFSGIIEQIRDGLDDDLLELWHFEIDIKTNLSQISRYVEKLG